MQSKNLYVAGLPYTVTDKQLEARDCRMERANRWDRLCARNWWYLWIGGGLRPRD